MAACGLKSVVLTSDTLKCYGFIIYNKKNQNEKSFCRLDDIQNTLQKQPFRGVLKKRCSENMQQIYRRNPCRSVISIKLQSNIIEIALRHGCSPVNLLYSFRTPFSRNTSERMLLTFKSWRMKCLTINEKITIFKTLALSRVAYLTLLTVAPNHLIKLVGYDSN